VGNLGEALWRAPSMHPGTGAVYLSSRTGDLVIRQPIPANVPRLGDADLGEFILCDGIDRPTRVVLEMTALDRAWFGEKREIRLTPE
jgi:hypothetical protein